jgi:hypothetical protein
LEHTCKIWFVLQDTNNSLLVLVSLVWNFDNCVCNWNKNLDLSFLAFKINNLFCCT